VIDLVEFAQHEFRLSKRNKDGQSLRETLATVERMTGRMPAEGINPGEIPDLLVDLWNHFLRLNATRNVGMGTCPITELEIFAFCANRRMRLSTWEIDVIRRLDDIALSSTKG